MYFKYKYVCIWSKPPADHHSKETSHFSTSFLTKNPNYMLMLTKIIQEKTFIWCTCAYEEGTACKNLMSRPLRLNTNSKWVRWEWQIFNGAYLFLLKNMSNTVTRSVLRIWSDCDLACSSRIFRGLSTCPASTTPFLTSDKRQHNSKFIKFSLKGKEIVFVES